MISPPKLDIVLQRALQRLRLPAVLKADEVVEHHTLLGRPTAGLDGSDTPHARLCDFLGASFEPTVPMRTL